MFQGVITAVVEESGQLKLPPRVVRQLEKQYRDSNVFVTSLDGETVMVYPLKEWERVEAKLAQIAVHEEDREVIQKIRYQTSRWGAEQSVDELGCIAVPKALADEANMSGGVVMLWHSNHIRVVSESSLEFAAKLPYASTIAEVTIDFERIINETCRRPEILLGLTPQQFEELVAEVWSRLGYNVELTKKTWDGGYDIIAVRRAEADFRFLIECKRYRPARRVGVSLVRALYGVKEHMGATKAILATTSTFTGPATEFLQDHHWEVEGRDFSGVLSWVKKVNRRTTGGLWLAQD